MKKNIYKGLASLGVILGIVLLWNMLKPQEEVDFSTDIKPIINTNCIGCHGGVKKNGGLD